MTALIVYPAAGYNTFIDVASADSLASDFLDHSIWDGLSADDKQRWILLTGRFIIGFDGFAPAAPQDSCLQQSQLTLIMHQLRNNLQSTETNQQIRIRKFDIMTNEYFKNNFADVQVIDALPKDVRACLEANGALIHQSTSGGVGSFRRHR